MYKRVVSILLLVLCSGLAVPLGLAQEGERPTVAILRFGDVVTTGISSTEAGILDVLSVFGYFSPEDRESLNQRQDYIGERIHIIWGDAGYDFNNAAQMVENALDSGADVLMTMSTPVTQIAVNATLDMDDPPKIMFANVFNAREAGIIQSSCIKPPHVSGIEATLSYDAILQALLLQSPDAQAIGTLFNPAETSSVAGAEAIVEGGEALGLRVEQAAVTGMADIRVAAQGLIEKGVEFFVLPNDQTTMGGLPAILQVANDNNVPVFHSNIYGVLGGAMVSAGFDLYYYHGTSIGYALRLYLETGDESISNVAIVEETNVTFGVNLDVSAELGVELSPELVEKSGHVVEDGEVDLLKLTEYEVVSSAVAAGLPMEMFQMAEAIGEEGAPVSEGLMNRMSSLLIEIMKSPITRQFVLQRYAESQCTPEKIAAQQAELDAMEG